MAADFVEQRPLHKFPMKSGRDILDAQYKGGRAVIEKADWARDLYEGLRRRCPHVPEEQLVRLFHDRSQSQLELIQGSATFAEYNASHPLGRKRVKVKPRPHLRTVAAPSLPPAKASAKPPAKGPAKPLAKKAKPKAAPKPKARPAKAAPRKAAPKAKRRR